MNLDKMRPGNRRAYETILERLQRGELYTSIIKPTRYGKRDLIIVAAYQDQQLGLISGALVFSPSVQATLQFCSQAKMIETIGRYELPPRDILDGIRQLTSFNEYQPFSNREFLLAANMQLCLRTNLGDILELLDAEQHRTGKPMAIFIDECHFVGEQHRWGAFFPAVSATRSPLILLTATAIRGDADVIPGFKTNTLKTQEE